MRKDYFVSAILYSVVFMSCLFAQPNDPIDTSPSYSVNGEWVEYKGERFFARMITYLFVDQISEYTELKDTYGEVQAFDTLKNHFNVINLDWWPLYVEDSGYLKLYFKDGNYPDFSLLHKKSRMAGASVQKNSDVLLGAGGNYLKALIRDAGLLKPGQTSGLFNASNPLKTSQNKDKWVLGPEDMRKLAGNDSSSVFFGNAAKWGHYQKNTLNTLMKGRGEFLWYISDEPEFNGDDWFYPADFLKNVYSSLTSGGTGNICLLSFGPLSSGNELLFSINKPGSLPPNNYEEYHGDELQFSYGNDYDSLRRNLKETMDYYRGIGNVVGLNDYNLIAREPVYAGYIVDWLKEFSGNAPVWFWIAPYQNWVSKEELLCQTYTAIVHGANGIGFWLSESSKYIYSEQLDRTFQLTERLKKTDDLITADVAWDLMGRQRWSSIDSDIHYTVRRLPDRSHALIAVNTSKVKRRRLKLTLKDGTNFSLDRRMNPLDVQIITF